MIYYELSFYYLHHEFQGAALLAFLVEDMCSVLEEELIWFEIDDSIVECF